MLVAETAEDLVGALAEEMVSEDQLTVRFGLEAVKGSPSDRCAN